ncbi:hypothetical protein NY2A_b129L [Paramecium bursaria Chlorella virus NY2A]|uniref:Uncharacterized protein b129L n=1 Tax=Paramecium bursaria Chlorella virus NY2A TaxID=46021 RepID=A7IW04_PBCVN|nr:hypothetical protein NY2A_b129L [Paramecium bursaria Chlorella virus NY2A]ABT14528.1 hypothetical protein NY2A_b129L [Paramecium bursaria Chlorella virus NY2A]
MFIFRTRRSGNRSITRFRDRTRTSECGRNKTDAEHELPDRPKHRWLSSTTNHFLKLFVMSIYSSRIK